MFFCSFDCIIHTYFQRTKEIQKERNEKKKDNTNQKDLLLDQWKGIFFLDPTERPSLPHIIVLQISTANIAKSSSFALCFSRLKYILIN